MSHVLFSFTSPWLLTSMCSQITKCDAILDLDEPLVIVIESSSSLGPHPSLSYAWSCRSKPLFVFSSLMRKSSVENKFLAESYKTALREEKGVQWSQLVDCSIDIPMETFVEHSLLLSLLLLALILETSRAERFSSCSWNERMSSNWRKERKRDALM